jgi:DNA-binding response OmpR family regulator
MGHCREREGQMAQHSPRPRRRRALIVDDETSFGIGLETDLQALGYDVCDLATNGQQAFLLAMSDQPDVALDSWPALHRQLSRWIQRLA